MSKAAELAALIANVNKGSSLAAKNFVINGAMNVAQRGTSQTSIGGGSNEGYKTVDRFSIGGDGSSAGRLTMTQTADGPSGFANCLKLACTTADTSIASGEYLVLEHAFEGQNLQSIAKGTADAKPITVSFYVKGNASATYVVELNDQDNSRSISKSFSVTTSWSRVELNIPADTTGAFDDDNAKSLSLYFWLHSGSNFSSGTLNTSWGSRTNANIAVGISSFFDSTSRTFFMTGLQVEIGEKATEFEHEPFETTLAKCHRYFVKVNDEFASQTNAYPVYPSNRWGSNQQFATVALPQPIRGQATVSITGSTGVGFKCNGSGDDKTAVVHLNTEITGHVTFYGDSLSYDPANSHAGVMFIHDDSIMTFDAEL